MDLSTKLCKFHLSGCTRTLEYCDKCFFGSGISKPSMFRPAQPEPKALWDEIPQATMKRIFELLKVKNGEYASSSDRLENFRSSALRAGISMPQAWLVFADKHFLAICNYIKDEVQSTTRPRSEPIEGRIDDLIVYLILLKLILAEPKQ